MNTQDTIKGFALLVVWTIIVAIICIACVVKYQAQKAPKTDIEVILERDSLQRVNASSKEFAGILLHQIDSLKYVIRNREEVRKTRLDSALKNAEKRAVSTNSYLTQNPKDITNVEPDSVCYLTAKSEAYQEALTDCEMEVQDLKDVNEKYDSAVLQLQTAHSAISSLYDLSQRENERLKNVVKIPFLKVFFGAKAGVDNAINYNLGPKAMFVFNDRIAIGGSVYASNPFSPMHTPGYGFDIDLMTKISFRR